MTNGPDIVIKNTKEKTYLLIDVAIPEDGTIKENEAEKELQYNLFLKIYCKESMYSM
jgi:hypothetical protein